MPDIVKILVVDDHEDNRKYMANILKREGYTAIEAGNGTEALQLMQKETFALVVSDILMPVMDGYTLCMEIRNDNKLRDTPIMVCTGTYIDPGDEILAIDSGADAYIKKPFHVKDFRENVASLLKNKYKKHVKKIKKPSHNLYMEYNHTLIRKLEKKMEQLQQEHENALNFEKAAKKLLINKDVINNLYVSIWNMTTPDDITVVIEELRNSLVQLEVPFDNIGINIIDFTTDPWDVEEFNLSRSGNCKRLKETYGQDIIIKFWKDGEVVIRDDLSNNDPYDESKHIGSTFNTPIRSIIDVPFSHGTLALNSVESNAFEAHVETIRELAKILSDGYTRFLDLENLHRMVEDLHVENEKRRIIETDLRHSEELYRNLVNLAPVAIAIVTDDRIVYINPEGVSAMGITAADDVTGRNIWDIVHPDYRNQTRKSLKKILRSNDTHYPIISKFVCHNSSVIDVEFNVASIVYNNKPSMLLIIQDISERMRFIESLQQSEEQFRELADGIPDLFFEINKNHELCYFNKTVELFTGMPSVEAVGKHIFNVLPYLDNSETNKHLRHVFTTQQPDSFIKKTTVDGKVHYFDFSLFPSRNGIAIIGHDLTIRMTALQQIKENEEKLQLILRGANIGLWDWNIETGEFKTNKIFSEILGYDEGEIEPTIDRFYELVHPEDRNRLYARIQRFLDGKNKNYSIDHRLQAKNGEWRWAHSLGKMTTRTADGKPQNLAGILIDISERKKAEQSISESEKKYRSVFENTGTATIILEDDGSISMANSMFSELTEYTKTEILGGLKLKDIVYSEEDQNRMSSYHNKRRRGSDDVPNEYEFTMVTKTGEQRNILIRVTMIPDTTKSIASLLDITESKRIQKRLIESETRHRTLFETMAQGVLYQDSEGAILQANPAATQMLGLVVDHRTSNMTFNPDWTFIYEDGTSVPDCLLPAAMAVQSKEEVHNVTFGICNTDWSTCTWVNVNVTPLFTNGSNDVYQTYSTYENITERITAYRQIEASGNRYRALIETAAEGILIVEIDSLKLIYSNPSMRKILGHEEQTLLNKNLRDIHPEDQINKILSDYSKLITGEDNKMSLVPLKTVFNTIVYADISATTAEIDGVDCLIGFYTDITERLKRGAEHHRLATVINQAQESIIITGINGTIEYVNPAFEHLSGYSAEEALGENPRILKSGMHDDEFYTDMWTKITNGETWQGNIINKNKDGSLYEVNTIVSPVKNDSGDITNFVAVRRDVTKERKLEKHLQESQKMEAIGTLAGGIAHDFNNILSSIVGFTELLLMETTPGSQTYSDLTRILKAGERATELINQILTFSRSQENIRKPINIAPIIKETIKFIHATLPSSIEIKTNINKEVSSILGDPTQIHQIVMNLCTNANHAMSKNGGILTIELDNVMLDEDFCHNHPELNPGDYIRLYISDTGTGIPQEILAKIFEPYFTTKIKGEGTGLGLSVVHGIINSYNGAIIVYSEPGEGTAFNIYIPSCKQKSIPDETASKEVHEGNEMILWVDDEIDILETGKRSLENMGYTVDITTDSKDALKKFRDFPEMYDLVISDMTMPGMPGDVLAKEIMKIMPGIPVILCSGFSERISEEQAQEIGIKAFLKKPVMLAELTETIQSVL